MSQKTWVSIKSGVGVLLAVVIWAVAIGEWVVRGFNTQVVLWGVLALVWTWMMVRRFRAVRQWRASLEEEEQPSE